MKERKRALLTASMYSVFLLVFSLFTYLGCYFGNSQWAYGAVLMTIAIPMSLFGGKFKPLYLLAALLNAIGSGIIASYYFTYYSLTPTPKDMLAPTLIALALVLLCAAILCAKPSAYLLVCFLFGIIDLLAIIVFVVLWCNLGGIFYPLTFFILILVGAAIILFGVEMSSEEDEILRDMAFASFGVLVAIGILVAILVGGDGCDCDSGCCECTDCGDFSRGGKKRTSVRDSRLH